MSPSRLPNEWIERLFLRFAAMYGSGWTDKWAGVPIDEVKATWAQDLGGFNGETLRRGLEHAKSHCQFPPSCPEFVAICRQFRADPAHQTYLPAPVNRMPAEVAAKVGEFLQAHGKRDPKAWARKILDNPRAYPGISGDFAREALGVQ